MSESWSESALGQLGGDELGAALQVVKRRAYSIYAEEVALTRKCDGVGRAGPVRACIKLPCLYLYVGWIADAKDTGHSFGNLENPSQLKMNGIARGARLLNRKWRMLNCASARCCSGESGADSEFLHCSLYHNSRKVHHRQL